MGVQDDFDLWERELGELPFSPPTSQERSACFPSPAGASNEISPQEPKKISKHDPADRRPGGRAMVASTIVAVCSCVIMILLGEVALGAAGLVLSSLIFVLWRTGL